MREKPSFRVRVLPALTLLVSTFALLGGCSLLYELDSEQCSVDGDCDRLGAALSGRRCVNGFCVANGSSAGGTTRGDSGGGAGEVPCKTHTECMDRAQGLPAACEDSRCITLVNSPDGGACGVVLGVDNLVHERDVFIFGAFSAVPDPRTPHSSPITMNFEYVVDQISARGGLRIRGKERHPVAVVCNAYQEDSASLDASFDHLVDRVGVKAIIASLYALELRRSFERVFLEKGKKVFFLSPFESDSALTEVSDDGLLWHLLPDSLSVAPAYLPLFARLERKVLAELGGQQEKLRVALVQNDFQWLMDVAGVLKEELVFNGEPARSPTNREHFLLVDMASAELHGSSVVTWSKAYAELEKFKPHIVVSAAGSELHPVISALETQWDSFAEEQPRPYYLLSPFQFGQEFVGVFERHPGLGQRVAGINTASAEDRTLYEAYLRELKSVYHKYPVLDALNGTENFYDAVLFTLLAAAAAGNPPELTGREIAVGMGRLVDNRDGIPGELTLERVKEYAWALNTDDQVTYALTGTLGPPNFNVGFGTRQGAGSVWCVQDGPTVVFDVLRYDAKTESLTGVFPCFELPEP